MLGLLHNQAREPTRFFVPTTASPFSFAAPDHCSWLAIGCRHGRALFLPKGQDANELLVWEPITGAQHLVPVPAALELGYLTAAVLCAADGCDHRDCLGGPFCVLFVFPSEDHGEYGTSACVYSSETGAWGEPTSTHGELMVCIQHSCVLVGSSLLYFAFHDHEESGSILEYDLSRHSLTLFSAPDNHFGLYNLVLAEDGGLGVIQHLHPHLKLWTREASDGTDARWVLTRVTFYTPVPRGNHQNLLLSKPGEEAGGEEGGEEEKTVNQAQQLSDHGSNAIKDGNFVNTSESIRHDHNIS